MKKALLMFAALLVAGCGEKSSSEGSESASESAEPSVDTAKPPPAEPPVAESPSGEPSESPNSLSDADVERLLKEAVDRDSIKWLSDGLYYQTNESEPYSGWTKKMYDSGQVQGLARFKDGKLDGLWTTWHENGQKRAQRTFKDGKLDGLFTVWHENGQKRAQGTFKDGKLDGLSTKWHENGQKRAEVTYKYGGRLSEKYWNSKGEEVETWEESEK
jgi:hypothetical protein